MVGILLVWYGWYLMVGMAWYLGSCMVESFYLEHNDVAGQEEGEGDTQEEEDVGKPPRR